MARVASIVIQDCDPYESEDDDKLWTVEELLLFEGTHKEQLLCLDKQSQWKTLQMADINDDDHHFKRRISGPSTCLLEDTEATDGDIDSPVSKIPPVARNGDLSPSLSPSPNQMTIPQSFRDSLSRNSFHMESSARSEPNSRRTSIISTFSTGGSINPKHYSVAQELLDTEQTYCKGLWLIEKIRSEVSSSRKGNSILPDEAVKEIFLNISQIFHINRGLLKDLDERVKVWEENPCIGDIMVSFAPFFKIYSEYSVGFDRAQLAYAKWLEKKKSFSDLIKKTEAGALCGGLPFSSYFLTPIQRIPRYKLLLQAYLKYLPADSVDRANTEKALGIISEAAENMNVRIKDLKKQARVVEIARKLEGSHDIVVPGREFLGRGPVAVSDVKGGHKIKQCVLFLFSDILIVTKITANARYKVKHTLNLHDLEVKPLKSEVLQHVFQVSVKEQGISLQFSAKNDRERDRWVDAIEDAVSKNDRRRSTLHLDGVEDVPIIKDPRIKSAVESMSISPTFVRKKSIRRRVSLRLKTMKIRRESDEPDSGNVSDVSTEFFSGKPGDRTSYDLDNLSTHSGVAIVSGLDNKFSIYMKQKALKGDNVWLERWYVLNSNSLVCYSHSEDTEPVGAISLTGYCASLPTPMDGVTEPYVLKLSHKTKRTFFFQLPAEYEFHKWFSALQELCECDVNKYGFDD